MAIDTKELFVNALLALCKKQSLSSISISTLLKETGAARQTFYNHFQDKNDLICYIYRTKIIPDYQYPTDKQFNFSKALLDSFYQMEKHQDFLTSREQEIPHFYKWWDELSNIF